MNSAIGTSSLGFDYDRRYQSLSKKTAEFIHSFFYHATECGHIQRNPTLKIQLRISDKIKGVLNDEQIKILLQKAREYNNPWALVWEVACYTGMRSGLLYAMKHDSIDLEGGHIFVKQSWCKVGLQDDDHLFEEGWHKYKRGFRYFELQCPSTWRRLSNPERFQWLRASLTIITNTLYHQKSWRSSFLSRRSEN